MQRAHGIIEAPKHAFLVHHNAESDFACVLITCILTLYFLNKVALKVEYIPC